MDTVLIITVPANRNISVSLLMENSADLVKVSLLTIPFKEYSKETVSMNVSISGLVKSKTSL